MSKRPDLSLRNRTDNPMNNPLSREKMRQKMIGKKASDETKIKMARARRKYLIEHPDVKDRILKTLYEKHTSKIAGTGWGKIKEKVKDRDGHKCVVCGESEKRLVVHHKDYNGRNLKYGEMNNSMQNLETMCDKCHNGFHRHKSKDYHERMSKVKGEYGKQ